MDTPQQIPDDSIDLADFLHRIRRAWLQILGLGLVGMAVAALSYLVFSPAWPATTSARVVFSFTGYERGEYPDGSKFQSDDLRAPEIVAEALKRLHLDTSNQFQAEIRAALTIEGIIPPQIVSERDRLRASGQNLPPFAPDEHRLTLTLPRHFSLSSRQRELLLTEIINVFRDRFQRTYAQLPVTFGNAFETLKDADYFEYELVLNEEIQNISSYLDQQLAGAKMYRSPTTNFSFSDLMMQTRLFTQMRLNETLGLIREHGLSRNRQTAITKMDYYLRTLEAQDNKAQEEAKVVDELLDRTQERAQNYVMAIKTEAAKTRAETPVVDQTVIDSLLANDAYNFLVRQALAAGLKVKKIQSERAIWTERRKAMESSVTGQDIQPPESVTNQVQKSLGELQQAYTELVTNIRRTHEDFERQQFADVVRPSMQPVTASFYRELVIISTIGAAAGLIAGVGISLLKKPD